MLLNKMGRALQLGIKRLPAWCSCGHRFASQNCKKRKREKNRKRKKNRIRQSSTNHQSISYLIMAKHSSPSDEGTEIELNLQWESQLSPFLRVSVLFVYILSRKIKLASLWHPQIFGEADLIIGLPLWSCFRRN